MVVRGLLIVLFGVWLVALPILTAQRVTVFRSNRTLWEHAADVNPTMPRARLNYADAIWKESQHVADTEMQLRIARVLLPDAPLAPHRKKGYTFLVNVELGSMAIAEGRVEEGQRYYLTAAATDPTLVKFLNGPPPPATP